MNDDSRVEKLARYYALTERFSSDQERYSFATFRIDDFEAAGLTVTDPDALDANVCDGPKGHDYRQVNTFRVNDGPMYQTFRCDPCGGRYTSLLGDGGIPAPDDDPDPVSPGGTTGG